MAIIESAKQPNIQGLLEDLEKQGIGLPNKHLIGSSYDAYDLYSISPKLKTLFNQFETSLVTYSNIDQRQPEQAGCAVYAFLLFGAPLSLLVSSVIGVLIFEYIDRNDATIARDMLIGLSVVLIPILSVFIIGFRRIDYETKKIRIENEKIEEDLKNQRLLIDNIVKEIMDERESIRSRIHKES